SCLRSSRALRSFPTRRSSDLFVAEAELVDHTQTGGVLRADVDLDAVESEREEAVVDGHRHGDGSDAATGHTRVDPVPYLPGQDRSEEHTSALQSRFEPVCRLQ